MPRWHNILQRSFKSNHCNAFDFTVWGVQLSTALPADQSTSYRHLGPGQYASASHVCLNAEHLAWNPLNTTWHETLAKIHLRWGEKERRRGSGKRGKRLRESSATVVERKGENQNRKKRQRLRIWGHERACLALSLCPQLFFLALFKWLLGHPSAAFSPLTGPHICFSHSSRALRSLKVQLN